MQLRTRALCLSSALLVFAAAQGREPPYTLAYPDAPRSDQSDVYHGVTVADPYRWMEDIDSPQTRQWVAAEQQLSRDYLDRIPGRERIRKVLTDTWNYERWTVPIRRGRHWFYTHNTGLQNQAIVFVTDMPGRPGRVLLDPNLLSDDGTAALREYSPSQDGRYFAYALSDAGSDWQVWHLRDVDSGIDLSDTVTWSKAGSCAWAADGSGFYYTSYAPPAANATLKAANEFQTLRFHRIGTPQSADTLVYNRKDSSQWFYGATVTDDGHYLIIAANLGTEPHNEVLVRDLRRSGAPLIDVLPKPDATYDVIDNLGDALIVRTDKGASHFRIVKIDVMNPAPARWKTLIPEAADTIDAASIVDGQIIVHRLKDAHSTVERYSLTGASLGSVTLPGIGTTTGFLGHFDDQETYYSFGSFNVPPSIYRLNLRDGSSSKLLTPHVNGFDPDSYETRQVFTTSKDGTRVPLFIVAAKGVKLDGSNPTILYGYGGFDVSLTPTFSPSIASWLQLGGVYVEATLRGGGEYGSDWHDAGKKLHKQNVFDDFIAAGDYLRSTHWTDSAHLALRGGSNGGLLIGAVLEQRPDLAAAAVPQVGVMDMLRFREFTVGKAWESDYGSVDDPAQFRVLRAYSPYHNVHSGIAYPATLVITGDHDDRVFPAHSFKFAAAMQHADPMGNPILLRVETRAGHGQGKPTVKQIDEMVDIYSFIFEAFGTAH